MRRLEFVVPGELTALTGGYLYDRHIVEGLRERGWQVRVHSLDASFPTPTAEALAAARAVFAALPDGALVAIDGLALGGLAELVAAERARLELVALVHHPLALETGLAEAERVRLFAAERDALACVAAVIVTSPWTRQSLRDYGVAAERIAVVEPGTAPRRARSGPARTPHRLLCVASLTPRKGHAVLLEALAALGDRDWRLDCIGSTTMDPACAAGLAERIEALGLGSRVRLTGELAPDALEARYADADTFVLASYLEGYGMAATEALAAGLPVVGTRAGATPLVLPAEACVLVPPGDAAALAAALAGLLDAPERWQRLAAAAREAGDRLPRWPDAVARFESALGAAGP